MTNIDVKQRTYEGDRYIPHAYFQKAGEEINMGIRSLERVESILLALKEEGHINEEDQKRVLKKASSFGIHKRICQEPIQQIKTPIDQKEFILNHFSRKNTHSV